MTRSISFFSSFSLFACLSFSSLGQAQEVIRHPVASGFPISAAIEVPADKTLVFLGGSVPDGNAANEDTREQTMTVLRKMQEQLDALGLGLGDVVNMHVSLVGVPELDGKIDFDGFMEGYNAYFGTEAQPAVPTRAVIQVVALANENWLVEIEAIAVRD